jgi:hypothetical protein
MNESSTLSRHKIRQNLNKIPPNILKEVSDYIEFLLEKYAWQERKILKFEGIWQGLGFEKLTDLESQIRDLREHANDSLLNRVEKWNI